MLQICFILICSLDIHSLFVNTPCYDSIMVRELELVMHAMAYTMTPWEAGHPQWKPPYRSATTKQEATMLLGQHCSWLSTVLNNIVEPEVARNKV